MKFSRIFFSLILVVSTGMEAARTIRRPKPTKAFHTAAVKRKIAHTIALKKVPRYPKRQLANLRKTVQKKPTKPAAKPVVHQVIHSAPHAAKVHAAIKVLPDQFCLPRRLQGLNRTTIHHLRVTQQIGNQCGSRAVANALALQDLINAGQSLTPANIRAQSQQYSHILINQALSGEEIANLAHDNHLMNSYVMGTNKRGPEPYIACSTDFEEDLNDMIREIRTQNKVSTNIIFNTGAHWVLITVIKLPGHIPKIFYMDSCNAPLQDNSAATLAINYLYQAVA